ncbi:MAG: 3-methyl-2-oxobutanoate hydroxymethyltransferase, partial [Victivallales bacterium]|nr:3-methyl-2-oxobutanoate hydroxymethyltransferase [Victivallales bacterium]
GDMPFMSYQCNQDEAVRNAGRYLKECGADGVKLEGGALYADLIRRLVNSGIPVMAHIGLLPQSVLKDGGYRLHGKDEKEAEALLNDARAVQEAGAFCVVLEGVPDELSAIITKELEIPTIGIGAGPFCDGQIQVITDILGLGGSYLPKHAKRYTSLAEQASQALKQYANEVQGGNFPEK